MKRLISIVTIMALIFAFAGVSVAAKAYTPSTNDQFDLGTDTLQYKDLRLGGDIYIEGVTHDAYETKITATDPTADRTVTIPDGSGTIMYTSDAFAGALADSKIYIGAAGGTAFAQTVSGDATITNAGAVTLSANSVSVSQAFINEVTLLVAAGTTTNAVTVDSGHKLMGFYLSTIGGINGANLVNAPAYDGAGSWSISMVNAVSADAVYTFVFLSDN